MPLAQTLAASAIGALVRLTKGCTSIGAKKTTKGHFAVCTDYVPDGDGEDGVTTLYISGDISAIVDIQTQAIKRTDADIVERRKAAVAMRRSEKYELGNVDLVKVHKEAKKEILRVGMPPLKEADIGLQESGGRDISWSFGKTFKVKGFTPPPSSKSALDVYDGSIIITGFQPGSDSEMLSITYVTGNEKDGIYPFELDGFVDGIHDDETTSTPPSKKTQDTTGLLTMDISSYANWGVIRERLPNKLPSEVEVLVADVAALQKAFPLPKSKMANSSKARATFETAKAAATLYVAELDAVLLTAGLNPIHRIPCLPTHTGGWAAALALHLHAVLDPEPALSGSATQPAIFWAKPRAQALNKIAKSGEDWERFLQQAGMAGVLGLSEREATYAKSQTLVHALERTLGKVGLDARPELLAPALITADMLLDVDGLFDRLITLRSENAEGFEPHPAPLEPLLNHYSQGSPMDTSGTEAEQGERSVLLQSGITVSRSPTEINLLSRIVDSTHDLEKMRTLIESASPDLKRLLHFGDSTVKALSNKIDLSVVNNIDRVRRSLLRQFEISIHGKDTMVSPHESSALHKIMQGKLEINLLHLAGEQGTWSREDPLQAFGSLPDGASQFAVCLAKLQHAWALARPNCAQQILKICTSIGTKVAKTIKAGGDFTILSPWFRDIIRMATRAAASYACRESTALDLTPPQPGWVTDMNHEWNVTLESDLRDLKLKTIASQDAAESSELKSLKAEIARLKALSLKNDRKRAPKTKEVAAEKKRKTSDKTKPGAAEAGKTEPNPPKQWDGRSRDAHWAHLLATVGEFGGKKPCIYFHTKGKTCTKAEADCFGHHHE